ncbi:hypothetical protein GEMRC1_012466 [Eukaryota sp. GEM-RC1]
MYCYGCTLDDVSATQFTSNTNSRLYVADGTTINTLDGINNGPNFHVIKYGENKPVKVTAVVNTVRTATFTINEGTVLEVNNAWTNAGFNFLGGGTVELLGYYTINTGQSSNNYAVTFILRNGGRYSSGHITACATCDFIIAGGTFNYVSGHSMSNGRNFIVEHGATVTISTTNTWVMRHNLIIHGTLNQASTGYQITLNADNPEYHVSTGYFRIRDFYLHSNSIFATSGHFQVTNLLYVYHSAHLEFIDNTPNIQTFRFLSANRPIVAMNNSNCWFNNINAGDVGIFTGTGVRMNCLNSYCQYAVHDSLIHGEMELTGGSLRLHNGRDLGGLGTLRVSSGITVVGHFELFDGIRIVFATSITLSSVGSFTGTGVIVATQWLTLSTQYSFGEDVLLFVRDLSISSTTDTRTISGFLTITNSFTSSGFLTIQKPLILKSITGTLNVRTITAPSVRLLSSTLNLNGGHLTGTLHSFDSTLIVNSHCTITHLFLDRTSRVHVTLNVATPPRISTTSAYVGGILHVLSFTHWPSSGTLYHMILSNNLRGHMYPSNLVNERNGNFMYLECPTAGCRIRAHPCRNACSGNGNCNSRTCSCHSGWTGNDCSIFTECNNQGVLIEGNCWCNGNYYGSSCTLWSGTITLSTVSVTGSWFNSNNWSPNSVPRSQDNAVFNVAGATLTLDHYAIVRTVQLNQGDLIVDNVLEITNSLSVTGGSLSGSGSVYLGSGASFSITGGDVSVQVISTSSLTFNGDFSLSTDVFRTVSLSYVSGTIAFSGVELLILGSSSVSSASIGRSITDSQPGLIYFGSTLTINSNADVVLSSQVITSYVQVYGDLTIEKLLFPLSNFVLSSSQLTFKSTSRLFDTVINGPGSVHLSDFDGLLSTSAVISSNLFINEGSNFKLSKQSFSAPLIVDSSTVTFVSRNQLFSNDFSSFHCYS